MKQTVGHNLPQPVRNVLGVLIAIVVTVGVIVIGLVFAVGDMIWKGFKEAMYVLGAYSKSGADVIALSWSPTKNRWFVPVKK